MPKIAVNSKGKKIVACAGGCKDRYPQARDFVAQQIPGTLYIILHLPACPQIAPEQRSIPWDDPLADPLGDIKEWMEKGKPA